MHAFSASHTCCDLRDTDQLMSWDGTSWEGMGTDVTADGTSQPQSTLCFAIAPSQPPGNIIWNSSDSKIILNWDQVKALDNESEVQGYKVSASRGSGTMTRHSLHRDLQGGLMEPWLSPHSCTVLQWKCS